MADSLDNILQFIATVKAEQFETLSDFQINIALAVKLGRLRDVPHPCEIEVVGDVLHFYDEQRVLHETHEDYCNDWNAIMPLVQSYKLALEPEAHAFTSSSERWIATDFNIKYQFITEEPQRALACCLLLMPIL